MYGMKTVLQIVNSHNILCVRTQKLHSCHFVINHYSVFSLLRYKHTNVGEHTEECSSVWEAYSAAGCDGKHPALPSTPHRPALSLWRCWFPKGSEAPDLEESNLFICGQAFKQLQHNRDPVDSAVGSQTIDTHRPVSKHSRNAKSMHEHRLTHTHAVLHMLKPLSCCLLSHYSIACYFLKQEKAIYPQRSVERFATRVSLGIWEVTLKFEECGEVWNLRNRKKKSSSGTAKLLSRSLQVVAAAKTVRDVHRERVL